ncbi:response regulator, partial [Salmonella enterica]|uniref:response regulator n=1 Tax=Salmonella enterica TaxID=28901 RepID=UPI0020165426
YQADLFNNGRDGLGAASKGQYDLIILDVMLPFLDGWQIISALRIRATTITVPAVANFARESDITMTLCALCSFLRISRIAN